jgi:hypothetical protein
MRRVKVDRSLDEEIWREANEAAHFAAVSFLFVPDSVMVIHHVREAVVEAVVAVLKPYHFKVPWGLPDDFIDVRKYARDRISVECLDNGGVSIDVRVSFESMTCELTEEQLVAQKMLSGG